jgi:flavin reductase (DIM6/NTAB) family NADH-FMN oxidoreductase RutF
MLAISVGHKAGQYKDTARNILATEEFVIHIASYAQLDMLHDSAEEHPPEISEVEHLGLATLPSELIAPPRLADAPVAMECRLRHCIEFGDTRSRLLVGEAVRIHLRDGLLRDGKVDTLELAPVARIGGPTYATLGQIITKRPVRQTSKG